MEGLHLRSFGDSHWTQKVNVQLSAQKQSIGILAHSYNQHSELCFHLKMVTLVDSLKITFFPSKPYVEAFLFCLSNASHCCLRTLIFSVFSQVLT